jgi:aspartate aminotransferase-like enzyme
MGAPGHTLRDQGMVAGGNYGPLAGKVFRIGHMGSQANMTLMQQGMEALSQVLGHAPHVIKS